MYTFIARRLLATLPVLLIVAVLVFLMLRLTPGDPAAMLAGDAASAEQIAAWRFGGWFDRALMGFAVMGFSIPVFVLAYILIWIVSLNLGWFPVQGYRRLADGFWPFLHHLVLPPITLSVLYIALIARGTRVGARGARRGLHPHGARQGLARVARAGAPRARQRRGADRHRDRHRHRAAYRRRCGARGGVRDFR